MLKVVNGLVFCTHKAISSGFTSLSVCYHHSLVNVPKGLEVFSQRGIVRVVRQPADKDLGKSGVFLQRWWMHDFQGSVHELMQKHWSAGREEDTPEARWNTLKCFKNLQASVKTLIYLYYYCSFDYYAARCRAPSWSNRLLRWHCEETSGGSFYMPRFRPRPQRTLDQSERPLSANMGSGSSHWSASPTALCCTCFCPLRHKEKLVLYDRKRGSAATWCIVLL